MDSLQFIVHMNSQLTMIPSEGWDFYEMKIHLWNNGYFELQRTQSNPYYHSLMKMKQMLVKVMTQSTHWIIPTG